MCGETSSIFACSHTTTRIDGCTKADIPIFRNERRWPDLWKNPITQSLCTTVMKHPRRERADVCIDCLAKQLGLIEVSDKPKGRDDLPRAQLFHKSLYYPAHPSRRLFRQSTMGGDPVEDGKILTWTPRRFCVDHDKIARRKEEAMAQILPLKQASQKTTPAVAAQKAKVKGPAPAKRPTATTKAQSAKGARARK